MPEPSETGSEGHGLVLEALPKEIGILLIVAGIGGVLLPGPFGTPFVLVGGMILFPKSFTGLDRRFRDRFPNVHREGLRQVLRFVTDIERRYPTATAPALPAPAGTRD
jgi:hypothetical protein